MKQTLPNRRIKYVNDLQHGVDTILEHNAALLSDTVSSISSSSKDEEELHQCPSHTSRSTPTSINRATWARHSTLVLPSNPKHTIVNTELPISTRTDTRNARGARNLSPKLAHARSGCSRDGHTRWKRKLWPPEPLLKCCLTASVPCDWCRRDGDLC